MKKRMTDEKDAAAGNALLTVLRTALNGYQPLDEKPNWDRLADMAKQQALAAIFYEGAAQYPEFLQWDPDKRKALAEKAVFDVTGQMRRTEVFLRIYRILLREGLRPLVLKGLVCRSLYGKFADYRPSADEDLLIPKGQFPKCREILLANGFGQEQNLPDETVAEKLQAISFYDTQGSGLTLEIHQNPFGLDSPQCARLGEYYENAADHAILLYLNGNPIYSLPHTDHYLFLFYHLYKHFIHSGVGIRQILDLMLYGQSFYEEIHWDEVAKKVRELSAETLYADVLELGKRAGFSADSLFRPMNPDMLLEDMLQAGVFGASNEAQHYSSYVTRSSLKSGDFHLLRTLFPSKQYLLAGYPYLEKHPYLLFWVWIRRLIAFVFRKKQLKNAKSSLTIGRRRIKLFQKYRLIQKK